MRTLLFTLLFFCCCNYLQAQQSLLAQSEFQVAYFGELIAHPGVKLGWSIPLLQKEVAKERERKRRGSFTVTKQKQLRLGSNIAFYHQVRNHNAYLWNMELTYRRIKSRSFKPDKQRYFEAALGLGYLHYQLLGSTFRPTDDGFEEIKGRGNAFMPSASLAWGSNIRWIKAADVHYYIKPSLFFEIPFGTSFLTHFALEIGLAMPLSNFKNPKK